MSQRIRRKNLLEISNQPELWIFSNLLAEKWIKVSDLANSIYERQVTMPIALPSGTTIFKIESDGTKGEIISVTIANSSKINLFQLIRPSDFLKFKKTVLESVQKVYDDSFNFFSYMRPYYLPKIRDFGFLNILGDTPIQDLADYGVKSRILQRISDPIQGYEVPQYWRVNNKLEELSQSKQGNKKAISSLRLAILDGLAKHAVIEILRCSIIALKHYADLLDKMTSEIKIKYSEEYLEIADGLYKIGEFQDSAVFYSKCLSQTGLDTENDQARADILAALKSSIEHLEPQEFLEYALFAAKVARGQEDE